jgi:hypothetical protein
MSSQLKVERDGRRGPESVARTTNTVLVEVIRDGRNGPEVIQRRMSHNTVVNTGKRNIMRLLTENTTKAYVHIRIGTSGAAVTSAQTNVLSPVAGTLTTCDSVTLSGATRTYNWVHSYPSGVGSISAANIQEVCILNQATSPGGSAWNRSTFTTVTKTEDDKLKITYKSRIT